MWMGQYGKRRLAFIIMLIFALISITLKNPPAVVALAAAFIIFLALAIIIVKTLAGGEEEY